MLNFPVLCIVMKKIQLASISVEFNPLIKVGGLADVAGSLPFALQEAGINVSVFLPNYKGIDNKLLKNKKKILADFELENINETVTVYQAQLRSSGLLIYLIDSSVFNKKVYSGENKDQVYEYALLSFAVLECIKKLKLKINVIQCHDSHTAFIPLFLKKIFNKDKYYKKIKTLYTIHNLAMQGTVKLEDMLDMKFDLDLFTYIKSNKKRGKVVKYINLMAEGINNADKINTVSDVYAKEILTKRYGEGLESLLYKRKHDLSGILNGIDTDLFNPEKDKYIKYNFNLKNVKNKALNKRYLQKKIGFKDEPNKLLIGIVTRLYPQKAIDIITKLNLHDLDIQCVILGVGKSLDIKRVKEFTKKYPAKVRHFIKFDVKLAQEIYAGSDVFIVSSRFEPCGLTQMIAMAYGTVPIVRKTGGLAQTVKGYNKNKDTANGFVFTQLSGRALTSKVKKAFQVYQNKIEWQNLIKNAMQTDFSWDKSAQKYIKVYQQLLK